MFRFNKFDSPVPFDMYLCRPSGEILYKLNGVDNTTARIKCIANNQWELSFDYNRFITTKSGKQVESNGYNYFGVGMNIYVERIGYFRMEHPAFKSTVTIDETKSITAYSIDCELVNKDLVNFKINTGEDDSLEMLVSFENGESENVINPYNNLPYDYILMKDTRAEQILEFKKKNFVDGTISDPEQIAEIDKICTLIPRIKNKVVSKEVTEIVNGVSITRTENELIEYVMYNYSFDKSTIISIQLKDFNKRLDDLYVFYQKYGSQLSLLDLALEKCKCYWSVGYVDPEIANKKLQFSIDSQNIYSFFRNDIADKAQCIIDFDLEKRKINLISVDHYGKNTGIIISQKNVLNSLDVSMNNEGIISRYNVSGADNLNLDFINFGNSRIDDLSYFMHAHDLNGNKLYMSDELAIKYQRFIDDKNIARDEYVRLTKEFNQLVEDISDLEYKVPNDYLNTDWSKFSETELQQQYETYNRLRTELIALYKEDYRSKPGYVDSSDQIVVEKLKTTEYWHDYQAYTNIMDQITAAITQIKQGKTYKDITKKNNKELYNQIFAFETEWTLYGTVELQAKIDNYVNKLETAKQSKIVNFYGDTLQPRSWSNLSQAEKIEYNQLEYLYNENYSDILDNYNYYISASNYLNNTLKPQLEAMKNKRDEAQKKRNAIRDLVSLENYNRELLSNTLPSPLPESFTGNSFTEKEKFTINLLYLDEDYNNSNILVTSLDTVSSTIDREYELLKDAEEQLSIASQPQFSFSADLDNLLALKEFKPFADQFDLGNYIMVQYFDNYYVKLRLISYEFNPCIPSDSITVEFSNFIRSKYKRSDITYLLENGGSSGSSGSGSGSGSSGGGTLGGDLDITLSNTMLSKLVNTELFGTAVTNVILDTMNLNSLTAKVATFGDLYGGNTSINGKCIKTGAVISNNYNGNITTLPITNTVGSILRIEDGTFNFGGGNFTFDGTTLKVSGEIRAKTGWFGGENGFRIDTGKFYSGSHSSFASTVPGVYAGTDGISLGFNFSVNNDGIITANGGTIGGWKIERNSGISNETASNKVYVLNGTNNNKDFLVVYDKTNNSYPFYTRVDGFMYSEKGVIGSFSINKNYLSTNGISSLAGGDKGVFLSDVGISCGKNFKVDSNGNVVIRSNGNSIQQSSLQIYSDLGLNIGIYAGNIFMSTVDGKGTLDINVGEIHFHSVSGSYASYSYDIDISGSISCKGGIQANSILSTGNLTFSNDTCLIGMWGLTFRPNNENDNKISLGIPGARWKTIYAADGTVHTSDEREKDILGTFDERHKKLFMDIKPIIYRWKSEGKTGKLHFGVGAQTFEKSARKHNIRENEIGAICHDYFETDDHEIKDQYGVKYDEIAMLTLAQTQDNVREIEKLKKENERLNNIIQKLLFKVS